MRPSKWSQDHETRLRSPRSHSLRICRVQGAGRNVRDGRNSTDVGLSRWVHQMPCASVDLAFASPSPIMEYSSFNWWVSNSHLSISAEYRGDDWTGYGAFGLLPIVSSPESLTRRLMKRGHCRSGLMRVEGTDRLENRVPFSIRHCLSKLGMIAVCSCVI